MSRKVMLVIPEAPAPAPAVLMEQRKVAKGGLRFGMLDNSKGNADHLLQYLLDAVKLVVPVVSVLTLRKDSASLMAPREILDRLAAEADFVVSAMAD